MARWKPLPAGLDPAVVRLVVQMRRYKDDSRLTLSRLASKTGFSTSSWERYLGGRALAPRPAVEALAEIAGGDQAWIGALYEAAAEAWRTQQPDSPASPPSPSAKADELEGSDEPEELEKPDDESRRETPAEPVVGRLLGVLRSRRFAHTMLTLSAGAVVGAAITLLAVEPIHATPNASQGRSSVSVTKLVAYTCKYTRQNGQWYAGNSTTSTDVLEVDMWGPEVAELQCLLQRLNISPGGIDGRFGPLTEKAVINEQKKQGLDIDGQVGPHTWAALRK